MNDTQAFELLTDDELYQKNANINADIVVPLSILDRIDQQMDSWARQLFREGEEVPQTPLLGLLSSVSGWSRSEGMKGSEQVVRSFMAQSPNGMDALGNAPNLTPRQAQGQGNTHLVPVVYAAGRELRSDLGPRRRRGWLGR